MMKEKLSRHGLETDDCVDLRSCRQHVKSARNQHPFGGTTYLYENVTKEIQLESRYNELIGVQRETLDNLHEGVALFGTDGRLKLHNPAFARFWALDSDFLDRQPHIDPVIDQCRSEARPF